MRYCFVLIKLYKKCNVKFERTIMDLFEIASLVLNLSCICVCLYEDFLRHQLLSKVVIWYVACSLFAKTCCNRTKLSWKDVLWPTWVRVQFCVWGLVSVQIMSSIFDVTWHATACIYWHTIYIAFLLHVEVNSMCQVMEKILWLRYCGVWLFALWDLIAIITPEAYKPFDPSGQTSMWWIGIFAFMLSRFLSYYYPENENVALIWHYILMPLYFSWWPNDTLCLNRPKKECNAYKKSYPHHAAAEQSIEARKSKERQWTSYVFLPIATAICYYLSMFYCVLIFCMIFCMILVVFCRPKRAARAKSKSEKTEQIAQRKKTTTNRFFSLVHQHYPKIIGCIVCVGVVYFSYVLWHFYSKAGKRTIPDQPPDSAFADDIRNAQHNVSGMPASQKLQEAFWNTTHYIWNTTHCIWEKITDFPDLYQNVSMATTKFSFYDKIEKATSALVDLFVNNAVIRMVKSSYKWVIEAMREFERMRRQRQEEQRRMQKEEETRNRVLETCQQYCIWGPTNWFVSQCISTCINLNDDDVYVH